METYSFLGGRSLASLTQPYYFEIFTLCLYVSIAHPFLLPSSIPLLWIHQFKLVCPFTFFFFLILSYCHFSVVDTRVMF